MNKNIKILFILFFLFITAEKVSAIDLFTGGIDPHDSLLFDGANELLLNMEASSDECFIRVDNIRGKATGKVRKKEIVLACGIVPETLITVVDKQIELGDILEEGTYLEVGPDSYVGMGMYFSGDNSKSKYRTQSVPLGVTSNSMIIVPRISYYCDRVTANEEKHTEEIKVIKGVVTYDEEPGTPAKFNTKGKRSSAKHTKTHYSHEVKIDGTDTVDVIRVYKGSVEVTYMKTDASDEEDMSKKIEKLGEDMQAGKLTAEEVQAKMTEFQNYGQNLNELMQPVNVDEGFKCTVTKNSRVVEPLGVGDEDISNEK
ncbi:MAG: hypothetical protein ABI543_05420 [Ignavibacteria bacterium]